MLNDQDPLKVILLDDKSEQYQAIDVALSELQGNDSQRGNAYDTLREAGIGRGLISRIVTLSTTYNSAAQLKAALGR